MFVFACRNKMNFGFGANALLRCDDDDDGATGYFSSMHAQRNACFCNFVEFI